MKTRRFWGTVGLSFLTAALSMAAVLAQGQPADEATLFRVFLKDGGTLVSYGETVVVGDRLVFSLPLPTSVSDSPRPLSSPVLQLVNIPLARVDWARTSSYAESARSAHYLATRAFDDYARLSNEVAETLNEVARTQDPARRLAIVETARKKLADWPAAHYNFNHAEVQQLLQFLDSAIADLRATSVGRFSLNLVATAGPVAPFEPLLPPPTLKESIEQVLTAATLAESASEKTALLSTALSGVERARGALPEEWTAPTASSIRAEIAAEVQIDRQYQLLSQTVLADATKRARAADVRGIQRILDQIPLRDLAFGNRRPDVVNALVESVQVQLDAARKLRLVQDQWVIRLSAIQRYRTALQGTLDAFARIKPALEDIRALAGSTPGTLALVERLTSDIVVAVSRIKPPSELEPAHALLMSAAQLAENAGRIRGEAARTANMTQAWDASAAAAGSLMLSARAQSEIQSLLRQPQLPQ